MKRATYLRHLILLLLIASLISSCDKVVINGSGAVITESRNVTGYSYVSLGIDAVLYITQGSLYDLKIEAQQNILNEIETNVTGDQLSINTHQCIKDYSPIRIYVTVPDIKGMKVTGTGSLYSTSIIKSESMSITLTGTGFISTQDSIITNNLDINLSGSGEINFIGKATSTDASISGSGNITLSGESLSSDLSISGSGNIYAYDFPVDKCNVKITGSGNAEVNVFSSLTGSIIGSGNIFYKGNPFVDVSISGSGNALHVD
ncbi:MAG: DUF2807 domain-containing protein [Chitinophagales bacterium]|nr:DUF2807 domain-containing protein [Chitinophagales bacterium]